jgi:hypothetical protein
MTMVGQILILGVCAVFAIGALLAPRIIPWVFVIGLIFVPMQAVTLIAGAGGSLDSSGIVKNHPITYIMIPGILVYFWLQGKQLKGKIRAIPGLRIAIAFMVLFSVGSILETLALRGASGLPTAFENYVGPFLLFLFLILYYFDDEAGYLRVMRAFVCFILTAALYGIFEYVHGSNFFFKNLYADLYWFQSFEGDSYRISTFLGHPLVNASYFLVALLLVPALFKSRLRYLAMLIFIAGIMVTGSRASFVIGIAAVCLFYVLKKDTYIGQLSRFGAIMGLLIVVLVLLFTTPLGQTIVDRFTTAEGSTLVRFISLGYLADSLMNPSLLGNGFGGSGDLSASVFHTTDYGFENPWLLIILDLGIVLALVYLVIVFYVHLRTIRYGNIRKDAISRLYFVSLLSCQLTFFMFNSFGTRSTLNYLFWFVAAGVFVHNHDRGETPGAGRLPDETTLHQPLD